MAHHPPVSVVAVELLAGHTVRVSFDDGVVVDRDLGPLLWGPVFDEVRADPAAFATVAVDAELGVIAWPGGASIDAVLLRHDLPPAGGQAQPGP